MLSLSFQTIKRLLQISIVLIANYLQPGLLFTASAQLPMVQNIRLTLDDRTGHVWMLYDLKDIRPGDSISVQLQGTRSGRINMRNLQGDLGKNVKAGTNRLIQWNALADKANLNEDVIVTIVIVPAPASPTRVAEATHTKQATEKDLTQARRSLLIPVTGLVIAAGIGGYSFIQHMANRKDANEYNATPYIEKDTDIQKFEEIRNRVEDRNKKIMTGMIGTGVILVADVIYMMAVRPKPRRTTLKLRIQSGAPAIGFNYKF